MWQRENSSRVDAKSRSCYHSLLFFPPFRGVGESYARSRSIRDAATCGPAPSFISSFLSFASALNTVLSSDPSIAVRLINTCWSLFKVALLLALAVGLGAGVYFYQHLNDEILNRVAGKLHEIFPHLEIKIHSATLLAEEGILVRGVEFIDPLAPQESQKLLSIDEALFSCRCELLDLAQGEPQFTQILIRRPTLHLTKRADGNWNCARLAPKHAKTRHACRLSLKQAPLKSATGPRACRRC